MSNALKIRLADNFLTFDERSAIHQGESVITAEGVKVHGGRARFTMVIGESRAIPVRTSRRKPTPAMREAADAITRGLTGQTF